MKKIYKFYGIDTAMFLLRPGASWEISNNQFTRWEDERPCPTIEEIYETIEKIKAKLILSFMKISFLVSE